jgi:hypothetical protein
VSLSIVYQLQTMFDVPQKLVCRYEARVFHFRQQILVLQSKEGQHGTAVANPWLSPAVQALQTLHQELDVADTASG